MPTAAAQTPAAAYESFIATVNYLTSMCAHSMLGQAGLFVRVYVQFIGNCIDNSASQAFAVVFAHQYQQEYHCIRCADVLWCMAKCDLLFG